MDHNGLGRTKINTPVQGWISANVSLTINALEELKKYIRSIKNFPKEGIMFRDITTLLKDPKAFDKALDELIVFTDGIKIIYKGDVTLIR